MNRPSYTKPAWAADLPDHTEDGDVLVYGAEPLGPRIEAAFVRPGSGEGDAASVTLVFDNGEARELDLAPLLDHPAFAPLRSYEEAERMTVLPHGHGVEWATGGDLSAGYAYREGRPLALAYRVPERAA
ncbi:DUF2442 domain-containing protein [Rubrivirga sp.]|uniref:DUF2442 domain-containing protein n=1 Tax=Rubrivirga sp. TaxID=1885344 RepID=UPI003B516282